MRAAASAYGILNAGLTDAERQQAPGAIFSPANINAGKFFLQLDIQVGSYSARDRISAGYAMVDLPLGEHARLIGGARDSLRERPSGDG